LQDLYSESQSVAPKSAQHESLSKLHEFPTPGVQSQSASRQDTLATLEVSINGITTTFWSAQKALEETIHAENNAIKKKNAFILYPPFRLLSDGIRAVI